MRGSMAPPRVSSQSLLRRLLAQKAHQVVLAELAQLVRSIQLVLRLLEPTQTLGMLIVLHSSIPLASASVAMDPWGMRLTSSGVYTMISAATLGRSSW